MSSSKRRKLDNQNEFGSISPVLLSEIDREIELEIAMKQQIADTFESRIAWAAMLKESLLKGSGSASQDTFRNVALDALLVVEQTSDHILCRDPEAPPLLNLPRATPRKVLTFGHKAKPSFLYLRSNPLVNPEGNSQYHLYLLKCPGCGRTTFTSLQGLLNHARLTHALEWGTHDECIRACAVVENDLDVDMGIEVAVGPTGILPGLRTIFQNAVGATPQIENESQPEADSGTTPTELTKKPTAANHLIRTLGLHEDSPALAPFLGKEAIRRGIKVWDERLDVDLEADDSPREMPSKRIWKMPFAPRNFLENAAVLSREEDKEYDKGKTDAPMHVDSDMQRTAEEVISRQSRFHFIARIIISDHSSWIPLEHRPEEYSNWTHKWMISVEAPSYARNITTVLNSVNIVSSDPNVPIYSPPAKSNPPFALVGFASQSFLAKVELSFTGTSRGLSEQKVSFMHWVNLEVAMGQEQVLDVELDNHTVLNPPQHYASINMKDFWSRKVEPLPVSEKPSKELHLDELLGIPEKNIKKLKQIAKRFPMFMPEEGKDVQAPILPYQLVPSLTHFKTLTMGRRKAIEWGRAKAIRDKYTQEMQKTQDESIVDLSVADVYYWMSESKYFPRERPAEVERPVSVKEENSGVKEEVMEEFPNSTQKEQQHRWCPICGIDSTFHATTKLVKDEELGEDEKPKTHSARSKVSILSRDDVCHVVPRVLQIAKLPRINIRQLLINRDPPAQPPLLLSDTSVLLDDRSLVSTADPNMTMWIRQLTKDLGKFRLEHPLKSADAPSPLPTFPLHQFGEDRIEVERRLSPFALLALATGQLATRLIRDGIEVANRDNVIASGQVSKGRRRRVNKKTTTQRLLTPTHILSGMLARGRGRASAQDEIDQVILLSLSKLGIAVEADFCEPGPSRQGDITQVKVEQ